MMRVQSAGRLFPAQLFGGAGASGPLASAGVNRAVAFAPCRENRRRQLEVQTQSRSRLTSLCDRTDSPALSPEIDIARCSASWGRAGGGGEQGGL